MALSTAEKVALLTERFINRTDVYSYQWYNENRGVGFAKATEGTCPNNPPCPKRSCPHIKSKELTPNDIVRHLKGNTTLGIYQLDEENNVKWMCFDVDVQQDYKDDVARVQSYVLQLGVFLRDVLGPNTFLVEKSGSKGYHIWVFFAEPVQARLAHSFGKWVDRNCPPPDGVNLELFPKQVSINKRFGNLVKLPLGVHVKTGSRCFFMDHNFDVHQDQWGKLAGVKTLTNDELCGIIQAYEIPEVQTIRIESGGDGSVRGGLPCMTRAMREGASKGNRDIVMFRTAVYCKSRGLPIDMTTAAMTEMNERNDPPMMTETLETKINSAYESDYSVFPCREGQIDSYCSSSCPFWKGKVKDRWLAYGRREEDAVGKISRD